MTQAARNVTKPVPAPAGFWGGWLHGATRPSWPAALGMIGVAAAWGLASILLVSPANLARIDARHLMTVEEDHYGEATIRAMGIAREPPAPFAVALLGSSALRESISHERVLVDAASQGLGRPAPLYLFPVKALNTYEMVSVMDSIGRDFNGVVIAHVGPFQLGEGADAGQMILDLPRLGFHTPACDDELRRAGLSPPWRSGVYLLDNWRFYSVRTNVEMVRGLLRGPETLPRHRYNDRRRLDTPERWGNMVRTVKTWWDARAYASKLPAARTFNR